MFWCWRVTNHTRWTLLKKARSFSRSRTSSAAEHCFETAHVHLVFICFPLVLSSHLRAWDEADKLPRSRNEPHGTLVRQRPANKFLGARPCKYRPAHFQSATHR